VPENGRPFSIVVDRELCMGSGMCIMYAPETFTHDAETKAVVIDGPGDPVERIRTAVEACPTGALSIADDQEGV
jgi:ferredoxin